MTARYWIAKNVEDVFRNEPRNVGVIVSVNGDVAARFVGERDDGVFDARKLGSKFLHPSVYNQWRDYWRSEIVTDGGIERAVDGSAANYSVVVGGEVADIGEDSANEVCQFLFRMLVSPGGVADAYQWNETATEDQDFRSEIADTFKSLSLLGDAQLLVRHPIMRNTTVIGRTVTHTPSFVQRNGLLTTMEFIDLARPKAKHIRERAGWMAYMFEDIKAIEASAEAVSIIRPSDGDGGDAVEFAQTVLAKGSTIVNWADKAARDRFMESRRRVADSV